MRVYLEARRHLTGMEEAMYVVPVHYGNLSVARSER